MEADIEEASVVVTVAAAAALSKSADADAGRYQYGLGTPALEQTELAKLVAVETSLP